MDGAEWTKDPSILQVVHGAAPYSPVLVFIPCPKSMFPHDPLAIAAILSCLGFQVHPDHVVPSLSLSADDCRSCSCLPRCCRWSAWSSGGWYLNLNLALISLLFTSFFQQAFLQVYSDGRHPSLSRGRFSG